MPGSNQLTKSNLTPEFSAIEYQQLASIDLELLGERIRRARLNKSISQCTLVEGLFTSAYLSTIELGKTRPTPATLCRLAERLNKSISYFVKPVAETGFPALNAAQDQSLQVQFQLLQAELYLAGGVSELATHQLTELKPHLGQLSSNDRARYHYLCGQVFSAQHEYRLALIELTQASQFLPTPTSTATAFASISELARLELLILIEQAKGQAELSQSRKLAALKHYRRALELAIGLTNENLDLAHQPLIDKDEGESESEVELEPEEAPVSPSLTQTTHKQLITTSLMWKLYLNIANIYVELGDSEQARYFLKETLNQAKSAGIGLNVQRQAASLITLSNSYQEQGNLSKAGLYLGRSSQIYTAATDQLAFIELHTNLAQLYLRAGKFQAAEQHATSALRLSQLNRLTWPNPAPTALPGQLTLTNVYLQQNKLVEARELLATLLSTGEGGPTQVQVTLYQLAAELASANDERSVAESYYNKALKLLEIEQAREQDTPSFIAPTRFASLYYSYGQQLRKWGELDRAFDYLEKALRASRS